MDGVVRVVTKECNALGLPVFLELSDGFWNRFEYDDIGRKVLSVDSEGWTEKYDYFENGAYVMRRYHCSGKWLNCSFNPDGELLYSLDSDGFWVRYTYDASGRPVYMENSDGECQHFIS